MRLSNTTGAMYYHVIMGNIWCLLAENTKNANKRDRYIQNVNKNIDSLIKMEIDIIANVKKPMDPKK